MHMSFYSFFITGLTWNALGQYFYDSLQISRLEEISLIDYYEMVFHLEQILWHPFLMH